MAAGNRLLYSIFSRADRIVRDDETEREMRMVSGAISKDDVKPQYL